MPRDKYNSTWQSSQTVRSNNIDRNTIIATSSKLHSLYQQIVVPSLYIYYKNRDLSDSTWSSATLIATNSGAHEQGKPDMAVTADDKMHMVYGYVDLEYREWDDGTMSSSYEVMNVEDGPRISPSHNDIYVIGITEDGSGGYEIRMRQRDYAPPEVTISGSVVNDHPKISWSTPSGIPDIDEYEIWRYRTVSGGGYTLHTTVTGTSYTDNSVNVERIPPFNKVYYKVKVVDEEANKSDYSNVVDFWDGSTSKAIGQGDDYTQIPTSFVLNQNYPNPFNPETKISFSLPEDSNVRLEIFNLQGQVVATLVDGSLAAGYYSATFDATSFPSGVYFYKIVAGNFSDIKRMLLVK